VGSGKLNFLCKKSQYPCYYELRSANKPPVNHLWLTANLDNTSFNILSDKECRSIAGICSSRQIEKQIKFRNLFGENYGSIMDKFDVGNKEVNVKKEYPIRL
jgi:hypothetical protein